MWPARAEVVLQDLDGWATLALHSTAVVERRQLFVAFFLCTVNGGEATRGRGLEAGCHAVIMKIIFRADE